MTKPISPKEVTDLKQQLLPYEVIESFNELIAEKWDGDQSIIKQKLVVDRIMKKIPFCDRHLVIKNKWLDVEDIYRKEGWIVEYDTPGYCETYDAFFRFKKSK